MNIKGIIFDFDGTLFDSMSIWKTAGEDYLRSLGKEPEDGLWKTLNSLNLPDTAKYLRENYALSLSDEEIMDGINKTVRDFYLEKAAPKEGVIEFLTLLKKKGIKTCIATLTDRCHIEAALSRFDMMRFFDEIFPCTELRKSKETPAAFRYVMEQMGLKKEETAVFEDALYAVRSATSDGIFTVGVYDKHEEETEKVRELADVYITSFFEAEGLIK